METYRGGRGGGGVAQRAEAAAAKKAEGAVAKKAEGAASSRVKSAVESQVENAVTGGGGGGVGSSVISAVTGGGGGGGVGSALGALTGGGGGGASPDGASLVGGGGSPVFGPAPPPASIRINLQVFGKKGVASSGVFENGTQAQTHAEEPSGSNVASSSPSLLDKAKNLLPEKKTPSANEAPPARAPPVSRRGKSKFTLNGAEIESPDHSPSVLLILFCSIALVILFIRR